MNEQLKQEIDAVKANGLSVFSIKIGTGTFIYRGMNRKEFRALQAELAKAADTIRTRFAEDATKMESELSLLKESGEEKLVMKCILDPKLATELDVDRLSAGVVTKLAELIMKASGFDDAEPEKPTEL